MRLPWSVFMSLILSGSVDMKLVYRFRILPKTARDMAVMMMVFMLLPSHTMKMGAMADFVILNSLPKSALAPLLIVWMGANVKTIITAGISVAIFGSVISIYSSFQSVEPDMLRLIATLGGTKKDMLFRVVLPWSFPGLLAVWKVNIGLCLVGVVIGEFIGAREGLGYLIIYGSQVFRYAHAREGRMTDDWNRMSGRTKRNAVWRTTRFAGPRGNGKNLRTV